MNESKKTFRNDLLLILGILLIASAMFILLRAVRSDGEYAVVTVDGKEWGRYPLKTNTEVLISTEYGKNLLVICDGTAAVTDADCENRCCVRTGAVRYDGETVVCLPHKLVVRIEGGTEPPDRPDVSAVLRPRRVLRIRTVHATCAFPEMLCREVCS